MKFPKIKNLPDFMAKIKYIKISKRKVIIGLIVVALIVGFFAFRGNKSSVNIETSRVQEGNLNDTISASARVEGQNVANLSFLTSGKLDWVGVHEGDTVKKGQVVASLDKSELELQLRKLLNNFEREFTDFDDSNYKVRDDVLTDEVRRIKKRAEIDLNQTVLDVEIQNSTMKLSTITSPLNGIVLEANPSVAGINVNPSAAKYTIVDPKSIYLRADVNEIDITKVYIGQKVLVKLDAFPGEEIESIVKSVGFQSTLTSTGGTAFVVKINLPDNSKLKYKLGMKGDVEFVLNEKKNILLVPSTSIISDQNNNYVWVVDENRKIRKTEIETGISSIDQTEIKSGLSKNETIITSPSSSLKEGQIIKK